MTLSAEARVAASAIIAEAVLPRDALSIEKAVLAAEIAAFLAVDPSVISTIWNPWQCPAELLPWLAWALSVDVWDDNWSEIQKRREIAAAPEIHRQKGTRRAVSLALQGLGLDFDLVEWWQPEPVRRRGTFRVRIENTDASGIPDKTIIDDATTRVMAAKPKSRVAEIRVGPIGRGPLGVSVATALADHFVSEPRIPTGPLVGVGPAGVSAHTLIRDHFISEPR